MTNNIAIENIHTDILEIILKFSKLPYNNIFNQTCKKFEEVGNVQKHMMQQIYRRFEGEKATFYITNKFYLSEYEKMFKHGDIVKNENSYLIVNIPMDKPDVIEYKPAKNIFSRTNNTLNLLTIDVEITNSIQNPIYFYTGLHISSKNTFVKKFYKKYCNFTKNKTNLHLEGFMCLNFPINFTIDTITINANQLENIPDIIQKTKHYVQQTYTIK